MLIPSSTANYHWVFNVYFVEKIDTACTVLIKVCEINATLINENGGEF